MMRRNYRTLSIIEKVSSPLGVEFNVNKASAYLREEDGDFFK